MTMSDSHLKSANELPGKTIKRQGWLRKYEPGIFLNGTTGYVVDSESAGFLIYFFLNPFECTVMYNKLECQTNVKMMSQIIQTREIRGVS